METLDFTSLDENEFDDLLDEIEQNEDKINNLDEWIRSQWKIGSIVSIYSKNEWIKGHIIKITEDTLQIKQCENGIIDEWKRNNVELIRPFFGAMAIYKYVFDAIEHDIEYLDESDAETPQPLDTPQPSLCHIEKIELNYLDNMQHLTLSDDDESLNGIEQSRSLELRTCTKLKSSSSSIKCITPTTQSIAEHKIKNYFRRRSVANIDHTTHRLFELDPDLLKIRKEYLERLDN